eukprot:7964844-Pyramimonas_sp.AAC.1
MLRAALDRQSTKTRELEQLTEAVSKPKSQYESKNDELTTATGKLNATKLEVATARAARAAVMGMAWSPTTDGSSV